MAITRRFSARFIRRAHFSNRIYLKIFRSRFVLPKKVEGRSNLQRIALRGMAIKSGYYVRGVRGCVTGCRVKRSAFVRGISVVLMSNISGFNGKMRISILGRAKNHRILVGSGLSTRRTCVLTLCHRHPRLVTQVGRVASFCSGGRTSTMKDVKGRMVVLGANSVGGIHVNSCYHVYNAYHLCGKDVGDGRITPMRVKRKIVYSSFVVSAKSRMSSKTVLDHYFIKRTYGLKRGCSTSSSLFFDGYRKRGKRTYTVFTKPCAIARRGSALLVTNVFSFVGTNSKSGRDGRVCGLKPVRRNALRHNTGAASSSCVL